MVDTTRNNTRNNYVDGQYLTVEDFQTEQDYFLQKAQDITNNLGDNGVIAPQNLVVLPDPIMVQPISPAAVAVAIGPAPSLTVPNPQNYTSFPLNSTDTQSTLYTVFQTITSNIQRIDLRITLNQTPTNETLDLTVSIRQLVDPTNPRSPQANVPAVATIDFSQEDIPVLGSDNFLNLDFSNENSGQGVAVLPNSYYAIVLVFTRPGNSTSQIDIFHSPLNTITSLNSLLYTWVLSNGSYAQGFQNSNGIFQQFQIYHAVYTSAVQIGPGVAHVAGHQIVIVPDQYRFIEIADRRNVDAQGNIVYNYIVLQYADSYIDPVQIPSTNNTVDSLIEDSSTVVSMTEPQWDAFIANTANNGKYLLLAKVNDSNIVSVLQDVTFTIPANTTNLAFSDWLNPANTVPNAEALSIQQTRPSDFIFYVANVPSQVPLTDINGNIQVEANTVYDQFGNVIAQAGTPIQEDIVRVVVQINFNNGANIQVLELANTSQQGPQGQFLNYAATISNLSDNPFDNVFTYNFSTDQLAPNVVYNYVAYTQSGLPIYIQDYNMVVAQTMLANGQLISSRNETFPIFLNQNSLTAVINQDLQLGSFNPASDTPQPGVVQYVPTLIQTEIPIPVGVAPTNQVTFGRIDTIIPESSFIFKPVPMVRADGLTVVLNQDSTVQAAYNAGDLTVFVDNSDGRGPIDITFSGLTDRDKGGSGQAILVTGSISPSVNFPASALVKVRNSSGRDNTNYSSTYSPYGPANVTNPSTLSFSLIARGYNNTIVPYSNAGFQPNELVYIYVNDQLALDINNNPITFNFSPTQTSVNLPTIENLGPQQYFREKTIASIQNSVTATPGQVLIDSGVDSSGNAKDSGQVIFNIAEIPTSINTKAVVTIKYNSVQQIQSDIEYYQTQYSPIGVQSGYPIANVNVVTSTSQYISVPDAFALTATVNAQSLVPATFQSVAIFVDGINITSLTSPIGQKTIVADTGAALLPGQVAFNPTLGEIKFFKQTDPFGNIISEAPSDFTRITIAYYKLDTQFVFNTETTAYYDPRYDINNDGRIDELDLNILNQALGTSVGQPGYIAAADFNNDGVINAVDVTLFMAHFGTVAIGEPDFTDATSARLNALLVVQSTNFLNNIKVVRAYSRSPDAIAPTGRTVLFLSNETPVIAGNYDVIFGFQAAMSLGFVQASIQTVLPLIGQINLNNIQMFEAGNPTTTLEVTQVQASTIPNATNTYDSVLTFTPAVSTTSTYTIEALWQPSGLAIFSSTDLVVPQKYEILDREVYGPFKLQYNPSNFAQDGTSISFELKATDATNTDGSPDLTGTHIQGVPISALYFTAHLTVANGDNTSTVWTWINLVPVNNVITLTYSNNLFIDHRVQGRNNAQVLTPFGLGSTQIALMPQYAGGDLLNDLSNISLVRSDSQSIYVIPHAHTSDRDGGLLTSHSIQFADDLARLSTTGDLTSAVYQLLDIINQQQQQIALLQAAEGVVRWDSSLFWDTPNLFWDS